MAANPLPASGPVQRREKRDEGRSGGVPSSLPTRPVTYDDGRCACCPYGYHIDLDFLNFCQTITNGSALSNLKRIQRTKRKLRKSMEFMLQQQQLGQEGASSLPSPALPPDVVHSTQASRLMHMVNYEHSATNQVLQDIDSAVNVTLASIDSMQRSSPASRRSTSTGSEEGFNYSPISPLSASSLSSQHSHFDHFFSHPPPPPPPPRRSSLRYAHPSEGEDDEPGRKDSMSSVSSVSTVCSEKMIGSGAPGAPSVQSSSSLVRPPDANHHPPSMTSQSLAASMATHFHHRPQDEGQSPTSPMSPNTTISKASLAAVREAMAMSLHRMRDLEDQVKAIPILQVRLSVLKEEKRLLALQLKARSGQVSAHGMGVGEEVGDSPPSSSSSSFSFTRAPWKSPVVKTPPPTLPKPSPGKREVGVGEHSVLEPYLLQPALSTGVALTPHQVQSEVCVRSEDKKISVTGSGGVSQDGCKAEPSGAVPSPVSKPCVQDLPSKPATRTIGVGEADVHAQTLQIHNTEVRTFIIGANPGAVARRNVGVEVKVPSRSVGLSVCPEDVAPTSRTEGVNVTGQDFPGLDGRGESEPGTAGSSSPPPEVRSVGTFCRFQPAVMDVGVQHQSAAGVSVGTLAAAPPSNQWISSEQDEGREGEEAAGRGETCDRASNTHSCPTATVATNTHLVSLLQSASQTERGVFEAMEVMSSTGTNTILVPMTDSATNTPTPTPTLTTTHQGVNTIPTPITTHQGVNTIPTPITTHQGVNTSPTTTDQGVNTTPSSERSQTAEQKCCDRGVNTPCRKPQLSMSKVECVVVGGEELQASPRRPLTLQEQIIQRGADQALAFLGSTSSAGSLSPTSPQPLPPSTRTQDSSQGDENGGAGAQDCSEVKENMVETSTACRQTSSQLGKSLSEEEDCEEKREDRESWPWAESFVGRGVVDTVIKPFSNSRSSRHRHSDRGRLSQDTDPNTPGIYSGQRVGSVEDFMPDEMRRLMNLDTVQSETTSHIESTDFNSSRSVKMYSKTTHTVTTKQIGQEAASHGVGKPSVLVDRTDTGTGQDSQEPQVHSEGRGFGRLSTGQLDLSQIAEDDDCVQEDSGEDVSSASEGSESEGIKDSGYDDTSMVKNGAETSSLQGLDCTSLGSLEGRELKSIMKTSKSETAIPKKGISFADSVIGGTGSSSEEEGTESDEESSTSYDEGSYDGREGDITYQCQDDEAIAQGLPGAQMYDQNIRETYELSEDMYQACQVLANYLVDSTTIQTKELNSNLAVVQEEWFRVSSHKLSSVHQVEDYLSSIKELSHRLLEYIVNLMDSNGNAAIHYCVSHCNFDIVGLLLDTEVCDVKKPNKAGYTPAMLASLAVIQNDDHRHIIRQLFIESDINARAEKTGQTALMLATGRCGADMVELLLETGADCNVQDVDDSTALMCACEHGHTAIVQLLLAQPVCDATLTDNEQSTALSIAMAAGHRDIGVILYKHLNFPGSQKKRKGSSSPTPSI